PCAGHWNVSSCVEDFGRGMGAVSMYETSAPWGFGGFVHRTTPRRAWRVDAVCRPPRVRGWTQLPCSGGGGSGTSGARARSMAGRSTGKSFRTARMRQCRNLNVDLTPNRPDGKVQTVWTV